MDESRKVAVTAILHCAEALSTCPIIAQADGIRLPDLSALPERWWPDRGRSEELVEHLAHVWLESFESALPAPTAHR